MYVAPEKLPSTTDATSCHSYRTYHQVQAWRGNDLPPVDWRWANSPNGLVPIRMDLPAAPEQLLKTIRCNCTDRCDNGRCTCRKNGLQCTPACGNCKGSSCLNAPQVDIAASLMMIMMVLNNCLVNRRRKMLAFCIICS